MQTMMKNSVCAALTVALLAAGCGRGPSLSEIEARERASRLYANAMADLQSGHVDAAIRGFEHVLVQDAGNYSAHFQLATLLQDIKKDYIGALAHYRAYLLYRPSSDKATVAADRMRLCDTLLGAEYLRKAGDDTSNKLTAELNKVKADRDALQKELARVNNELDGARRAVEKMSAEQKMHRRLIAKLGDGVSGGAAVAGDQEGALKKARAELKTIEAEEQRRRLRPTDAELLEEEDEPKPQDFSADVKALRDEFDKEDLADADNPLTRKPDPKKVAQAQNAGSLGGLFAKKGKNGAERPSSYVVQEGDTLFKISMRFYGTSQRWRAIRELNKATVPPDGRLRVGQELRLP